MSTNSERIIDAQNEIAKILARLERETGQRIEHVDIHDIDVTTMGDRCPRYQSSVRITLQQTSVRDWE
jgi:hypothetical protein